MQLDFNGTLEIILAVVCILLAAVLLWAFKLHRQQKKQTLEINQLAKKYNILVENSSEGVIVVCDQHIVFANSRLSQLTDYTHDELLALDPFEVAHPEDREMVANRYLKRMKGTLTTPEYPFRAITKSGKLLWIRLNSNLIEWEGKPATLYLLTDISESKNALEAIKEGEEHLKLAMDATNDGLWDIDLGNNQVYFSPHYYTMLGYKTGEFSASHESWVNLLHPEDREKAVSFLNQVLETGQPATYEQDYRLKTKDGNWCWVLTRGRIVKRAADGKPLRMVGTHMDISARKLIEEALRNSEEKFATVFKMAPYSISLNRLSDQAYMDVNQGFTETLGWTPEEVVGKTSVDIHAWVNLDERARFFQELAGSGVVEIMETRMRRKNGSIFDAWVSGRVVNIQDEHCTMTIVRDVSRSKLAELALRKSEERYRRLFEGAILGVFQSTFEGKALQVNPAFARMFGYDSPEDAIQSIKDVAQDIYVNPPRRADLAEAMKKSGGSVTTENLYKRKDGSIFTGNLSVWLVNDDQGKLLYLEGFIEDISARKEAETRIQRQLQHLAALRSIDLVITGSLDLSGTLRILLEHVVAELKVDAVDVLLLNPLSQELEYAADIGFRTNDIRSSHLPMGRGYAGRAALERQIVQATNLAGDPDYLLTSPMLRGEGFQEYYGIPLVAKDMVKGVLEVYHRSQLDTTEDWMNFLAALAGQAAIAVDNATLFEGMQQANTNLILAYDATIEGWARALELRDGETEDHSQRVAALTITLAQAMGINAEDLVQIRRGALLHDIGKMSIPDSILLKPGALDEQEWTIMRQHPVFAYKLLSPIEFLRPALDIPYCHHEKWNGTGYPRGLKGEEIPLAARIFAVVDVWDALCSDRPYRPAWKRQKALDYIQEQSAIHFDPQVIEIFLKLAKNDQ